MKPILFGTEMVRAILDGRKTQTRVVIKIPYPHTKYCEQQSISIFSGAVGCKNCGCYHWDDSIKQQYQVGDILYVKEEMRIDYDLDVWYVADDEYVEAFIDDGTKPYPELDAEKYEEEYIGTVLAEDMPKEAARIFLRVKNVRVERLQDISEEDCLKEGMPIEEKGMDVFLLWWMPLWNSTAKEKYKWEDNPYVFVYEFEKVEKPCA